MSHIKVKEHLSKQCFRKKYPSVTQKWDRRKRQDSKSVQLPVSLRSTHLNHLWLRHHGGWHQISGDIHGSSECPCCPCTLALYLQTLGRNTAALPQALVMLAFAPSRKGGKNEMLRFTGELCMQSKIQAPWLLQNQPVSLLVHNRSGRNFKGHNWIWSRTAKQSTVPHKLSRLGRLMHRSCPHLEGKTVT